jgi:hypothetical protein
VFDRGVSYARTERNAPATAEKGRPKGARGNKISGALKELIIGALADAGEVNYLHCQADENPVAFMTLLGKVLPLQVKGDPIEPLVVVTGVPRAGD